jgi:hypothetical protein
MKDFDLWQPLAKALFPNRHIRPEERKHIDEARQRQTLHRAGRNAARVKRNQDTLKQLLSNK